MQEVAQYTYQYEHFPEVLGMLWRRFGLLFRLSVNRLVCKLSDFNYVCNCLSVCNCRSVGYFAFTK